MSPQYILRSKERIIKSKPLKKDDVVPNITAAVVAELSYVPCFCWCYSLWRQLLYTWPTLIKLPVPLGY